MTCPRCGAAVPPGAAQCAACGAARAPVVTAGVLTPVADVTGFDTIAPPTPHDADTTGLPDDIETSFADDPDETRLGGPSGAPAGDGRNLVPGQAFGTRYHIIRLLGIGGMGAVYHAWDAELGVAVALKVIRSDVSAD